MREIQPTFWNFLATVSSELSIGGYLYRNTQINEDRRKTKIGRDNSK